MKTIFFLTFFVLSLFADNTASLLNKINQEHLENLKDKNYENFNIESIGHYSKIDASNIYLSLLKDKVSSLDKNKKK